MAPPPPQRHRAPVTSRRYLSIRHANRLVKAAEDRLQGKKQTKSSDGLNQTVLKPGWQQLYSKDVPGLQGGDYTISVQQKIHGMGPYELKQDKTNVQPFHIQAPRFSLPSDAIYSVYPPSGQAVNNDVLPHIVFNDPMMPWERKGSTEWEKHPQLDSNRNRIPWLALLTFTADELTISNDQLKSLFANNADSRENIAQGDTLAAEIAVGNVLKLNSEYCWSPPFRNDDLQDATSKMTSLIFPKARLFNALFSSYCDDGKPTQCSLGAIPDISRHRFLAHVRGVHTEGMAYAGELEDDPVQRDFGIIICNRGAPSALTQSTSLFVHLVSLEKIEKVQPFPVPEVIDGHEMRVAMISLNSWIYTCLPPVSIDTTTRLLRLRDSINSLRPIFSVPGDVGGDPTKMRALQRIKDGYSIVRYYVQTGEETVAFARGGLTPTVVEKREIKQSNSGANLQIMDRELGIMDISYSAAWQLGRTMALANRAYTTALVRLRRQILEIATDQTKIKILKASGRQHLSKLDIIESLEDHLDTLHSLSLCDFKTSQGKPQTCQWTTRSFPPIDISYRSPATDSIFDQELRNAAFIASSAKHVPNESRTNDAPPSCPEYQMPPNSSDWPLVLRFILDLYHLVNIPMHYLITDPSHLPDESLRFFYIDQNWVDALVDGALSLGNQIDPQQDCVRGAIKQAINKYITTINATLEYSPPLPRFGFFLRSVIITQFPDLKVEIPSSNAQSKAPILLRHEVITNDTMVGLISARPIEEGLKDLKFTIPCHQQYFTIGGTFDKSQLVMLYKRVCTTVAVDTSITTPIDTITWQRGNRGTSSLGPNQPVVYKWGSSEDIDDVRLLLVDKLAQNVHKTLTEKWKQLGHPDWYCEANPTSAMMGIQLNVTSMQLVIELPPPNPPKPPFPSNLLSYPDIPHITTVSVNSQSLGKIAISKVPPREARQRMQPISIQQIAVPSPYHRRIISAEALDHKKSRNRSSTSSSWSQISSRTGSVSSFVMVPSLSHSLPLTPNATVVASTPKFRFNVWPANAPYSSTVPMLKNQPQDLIFSVIRTRTDDAHDFQISSVVISFDVGSAPKVPTLIADYVSINASMLSNLRFNVRAAYSNDSKKLELRLVPRSHLGWVWVKDMRECSVWLSGVQVRADWNEKVNVTVSVQILYTTETSMVEESFEIVLEPVPKSKEKERPVKIWQ